MTFITYLKDQTVNRFKYRTQIGVFPDYGQVSGPLRPTADLARADRARMEAYRSQLEEQNKTKKEILEAMQARAKEIRDEVKATKTRATMDGRNEKQRERYANKKAEEGKEVRVRRDPGGKRRG